MPTCYAPSGKIQSSVTPVHRLALDYRFVFFCSSFGFRNGKLSISHVSLVGFVGPFRGFPCCLAPNPEEQTRKACTPLKKMGAPIPAKLLSPGQIAANLIHVQILAARIPSIFAIWRDLGSILGGSGELSK